MSCLNSNSGWLAGQRATVSKVEKRWYDNKSLYVNAIVLRTLCIDLQCDCWQHAHTHSVFAFLPFSLYHTLLASTHIHIIYVSFSLSLSRTLIRLPFCFLSMFNIALFHLIILLFLVHFCCSLFFVYFDYSFGGVRASKRRTPNQSDGIFMDYCHSFLIQQHCKCVHLGRIKQCKFR